MQEVSELTLCTHSVTLPLCTHSVTLPFNHSTFTCMSFITLLLQPPNFMFSYSYFFSSPFLPTFSFPLSSMYLSSPPPPLPPACSLRPISCPPLNSSALLPSLHLSILCTFTCAKGESWPNTKFMLNNAYGGHIMGCLLYAAPRKQKLTNTHTQGLLWSTQSTLAITAD